VKDSTYNPRNSKPSTSTPKSPPKTSSQECFKCLRFGHIAANCPSKRNMMVKGGVVMSDHSSKGLGPLPLLDPQVKKKVKFHVKDTY